MKKNKLIWTIILVVIFIFPHAMYSQGKKMNIMDYYLALPDDCFYCEIKPNDLSTAYKKKQVIKTNINAGYIAARSENYIMQVALFVAPGINVVAVNRPCGAGCMCNMFRLLVPQPNGKWSENVDFPSEKEIRARIKNNIEYYEFVLPEIGTDIKVIDPDTKKTILIIAWVGGKFRIK